jgi:hypothetical protein
MSLKPLELPHLALDDELFAISASYLEFFLVVGMEFESPTEKAVKELNPR